MSTFGVSGWSSEVLSVDFALLTILQSEHGCAPLNVLAIAWHSEVCFALSTIIAVQAMDWSASHCRPIAQHSAKIVIVRQIQRSTLTRLGTRRSWVNQTIER